MKTTAIEYFRSAVNGNRIIQGDWYRFDKGKHYVCLAAAFGKPGTINKVEDCPVGLFPRWVFELMPTLNDGVHFLHLPLLIQQFAKRIDAMVAFTPQQWESVRVAFLIGLIDLALDADRSRFDPSRYWKRVDAACLAVKKALISGNSEELETAKDRVINTIRMSWTGAAGAVWRWVSTTARMQLVSSVALASVTSSTAQTVRKAAYLSSYLRVAVVFFSCVDNVTVNQNETH